MNLLVIDDQMFRFEAFERKLKRMKADGKLDFHLCDEDNVADMERDLNENLRWSPDLILLDIMIPPEQGGDNEYRGGLDLLVRIKDGCYPRIPRETKVVLMSAVYDMDKIKVQFRDIIHGTLVKPFGMPQAIGQIMDVARGLEE